MPNVPGHRWQDRRAELDMDQGTAAEALGINKRTLQNIETTSGFYVSLRVIHRAARLYGRTTNWLQGKDDDKPEKTPKQEPARREPSGDPSGPPPRPDRDRKGPPRVDNGLKAAS